MCLPCLFWFSSLFWVVLCSLLCSLCLLLFGALCFVVFRWCPSRSSAVSLLAIRVYFNIQLTSSSNWMLKRTQATLTYGSQLGRACPFGSGSFLFFCFLRSVFAFLFVLSLFLVLLLGCSATLMSWIKAVSLSLTFAWWLAIGRWSKGASDQVSPSGMSDCFTFV